ncbi:flagellin N-terminal helical domain-containing protein [Stenotrophomonas sp. JC08]|uniref:flagellin N-terminal helical domain-containing protein n=1 Tax=Stenotrophomonas sp. JC08 TaxID=3445779 RepID=UPI003FA2E70F
MAQIINTNIMSLNAQRNLNTTGTSLATTIQRLSSGLRINSAKDDAAGLAISERFTTQIRGMDQAARNANDGISLAQTAEGALGEIGNNLQRIRELAVQSRNATNSDSDRAALDAEVQLLKAEIQRVAEQTNFNGTPLLNGSFQNQAFQVGADQGQVINIAQIANANISALGNWNRVDTAATVPTTAATGGANAGTPNTGAGTINTTNFEAPNGTATPFTYDAFSLTINGKTVQVSGVNDGTNDGDARTKLLANITNAINNDPSIGGPTGIQVGAGGAITNNGAALTIGGPGSHILGGAIAVASATGYVAADFTEGSFKLTGPKGETVINYPAAGGSAQRASDLVKIINNQSYNTGVTASLDNGKLLLSSASGNVAVAATATGATADVDLLAATGLAAGATGAVGNLPAPATAIGTAWVAGAAETGFAELDITTAVGADNALNAMDAALQAINSSRADLGAIQNRFTSTIANLNTTSENLSASRSRIRDADYAKETAELTRTQILQQAGTAMLAQANQVPQNVLSLLK